MSRRARAASALTLTIALYQLPGGANGVPAPPARSSSSVPRTPEAMAVEAYNKGLESRNRGLKAESQAAKATRVADRVEHEKKARQEFDRAFKNFKDAATHNPALPQAWNGMGYAHRKLGDYAKALEHYERALQIAPNFSDAIEYRAEAYLALNRIDEAKQAYLALFALDRKQAELLMTAMQTWVAKRKIDPAGADPAAVTDLETWIRERSAIAQQTRLMGRDTVHRAW